MTSNFLLKNITLFEVHDVKILKPFFFTITSGEWFYFSRAQYPLRRLLELFEFHRHIPLISLKIIRKNLIKSSFEIIFVIK